MIEVKNLSFAYGKREILRDVSFKAESGEIVGILGNNGAGKSTLVTCLNHILKPKSGKIILNGKDAETLSKRELAQYISYVAQKNEQTQTTVFDSVLLGRKPYIKEVSFKEAVDINNPEDFQLARAMVRIDL